jgi:uncharacterized membrane protein
MRGLRGMSFSLGAIFLSAGFATLAACSRVPEPAAAPAPAAAPPAVAEETTTESEPPAESGLAIKRGIAVVAADHSTFRPCNEKADLWLIDQTDGILARTFASENAEATANEPLKLYIEAYGERAPVSEDIPAARAYAGTFILEEALYATPEIQGRGCELPAQDYIVAAHGSEPFWSIEVTETTLVWRQPEEPKEISLAAAQTQDSEGAVSYTAAGDGHQMELMIEAQSCRDAVSGEYFAYAARASLDGKRFTGCARVGR